MIQNPLPIIKILFYAPGTGFSTQISNVPFTIAHKSAGDKEVTNAKNIKGEFNIDRFFSDRGNITDKRMIPGFITLVATTNDITNSNNQQIFDTITGGTAGHMYRRLIDYNMSVQKLNKTKPSNKQTPLYSIYTVIDKPNDSTNLNYLLKNMLDAGYQNSFFDVCITASKGIDQLLTCVNKYNLDTNLVLVNGGASGYMSVNLAKGSKVRAIVLTHGGQDKPIIGQQKINDFLNGNPTKLFIYSNNYDGHNQASLILGDTNLLHFSLRDKVNRQFSHSFLPILVNSVYYVGRQNADWSFLMSFLAKDKKFVNMKNNFMVGGGRPSGRSYCGCSGGPIMQDNMPLSFDDFNNIDTADDSSQYDAMLTNIAKLYCECDRKSQSRSHSNGKHKNNYLFQPSFMFGGSGNENVNKTNVDKTNIIDYLYPVTSDSPFSDKFESDAENELESNIVDAQIKSQGNEQKGGYMMDRVGYSIVGKSVLEMRYLSARVDYLNIRNL